MYPLHDSLPNNSVTPPPPKTGGQQLCRIDLHYMDSGKLNFTEAHAVHTGLETQTKERRRGHETPKWHASQSSRAQPEGLDMAVEDIMVEDEENMLIMIFVNTVAKKDKMDVPQLKRQTVDAN